MGPYTSSGSPCNLERRSPIAAFVDAVQAPVNILACPKARPTTRLAELGVARISYGSSIHRRSMQELAVFLADIAR